MSKESYIRKMQMLAAQNRKLTIRYNDAIKANVLYNPETNRYFNPVNNRWIIKVRSNSSIADIYNKELTYYTAKIDGIVAPYNIYSIDINYEEIFNLCPSKYKDSKEKLPFYKERIEIFLSMLLRRYWQRMGIQSNSKTEDVLAYFPEWDLRIIWNWGKMYESIVPKKQKVINVLEKLGYIERVYKRNHHNIHQALNTFRPTNKLLSATRKKKTVEFTNNHTMLEKYYEHHYSRILPEFQPMVMQMTDFQFHISKQMYITLVSENYENYKTKQEAKGNSNYSTKEEYIERMLTCNYNRLVEYMNVKNIREYADFFTTDTFSKRFHSIFSTMPTTVRDYIKKNINLEGVDMHQSQPSFLAEFLASTNPNNSFTQAVNNGDIYCKIIERSPLIKKYTKDPDIQRRMAKERAFNIFFGKVWFKNPKTQSVYHSKVFSEFQEMFPDVYNTIKNIKTSPSYRLPVIYTQHLQKLGVEEADKTHARLPQMLQMMEVRLMRGVWRRLLSEGIRFIAVHDEIVVDKKHIDRVRYLFQDEIDNFFNYVRVKLKKH